MCIRFPDALPRWAELGSNVSPKATSFSVPKGSRSGLFDRTSEFSEFMSETLFLRIAYVSLSGKLHITSTNCDPSVSFGLCTAYHDVDLPLSSHWCGSYGLHWSEYLVLPCGKTAVRAPVVP